MFLEVVSPEDYPDYFELITQPMSIDIIEVTFPCFWFCMDTFYSLSLSYILKAKSLFLFHSHQAKSENYSFNTLKDFEKDFHIMVENAKIYNQPKSGIYKDSETLKVPIAQLSVLFL